MDDALLVRRRKAPRDLDGVLHGLPNGQCARAHPPAEGLALQELGHRVDGGPLLPEVEDGQDVRVAQRGHCLRLAVEPGKAVRALRELRRQDLYGNIPPQASVPRLVHLSHPPRTEGRDDFVRAEACTVCQTHITVLSWLFVRL